ncbi:MAG: thiol:disulfide interchange protein DsbA/DsbL [Roseivirga sp.]|nr:thiol:disulfide interchange protein DsbA/DsbL [Roseivirga sp.]
MRTLVFLCLFGLSIASVQAQFNEGVHYKVVSETKTEKPTVTEFFSLFCGHCYQGEEMFQAFAKALPEGTSFEKSHVTYIPRDNPAVGNGIVQAFIAMEKLGKSKELTKVFFDYIHKDQKEIASVAAIKEIFVANGVTAQEFDAAYNDKEVKAAATVMQQAWLDKQIESVPTLVVNGKYRVNMRTLKSTQQMDALVKFLLAK